MAFFKNLNDNEFGQALSFASNASGVVSATIAGINFLKDEVEGSDTDHILDAISQLKQIAMQDFDALGDLIRRQFQLLQQTVDANTVTAALSQLLPAMEDIQQFIADNNPSNASSAEDHSQQMIGFFLELDKGRNDLGFFMPGLVVAGTARLFIVANEPPTVRKTKEIVTAEVKSIVDMLGAMIDSVSGQVDAKHNLVEQSATISCPAHPNVVSGSDVPPDVLFGPVGTVLKTILDSIQHTEHDDISESDHLLETFSPSDDPCSQNVFDLEQVRSIARDARVRGVNEELAAMGIPNYKVIQQQWSGTIS